MYRDDFILRHIRLFVMAIAKALGLIEKGDLGFALETVRVSFADLLGMSLDDFLAYPDDRVKDYLYFGELGSMGINRAAFAAQMLGIAARIYAGMGSAERSLACTEKALRVLLETTLGEEEDIDLPEHAPQVEELLAEVDLSAFSDELLSMLAFHFDRGGELDRAERTVRMLIARRPHDPDVRATARSFYEYLLDEDEAKLQANGMSIEGIRRAFEELAD